MEANKYSSSSSSSSSSAPSPYIPQYHHHQQQQGQAAAAFQEIIPGFSSSFHASLHAVRKPPVKPWKKPIAPLPPTPPRVYKVDPVNFRDLVQKLTGAAATPTPPLQRLQSVAPPPLEVSKPSFSSSSHRDAAKTTKAASPLSAFYTELMSDNNHKVVSDNNLMTIPSTSLTLSPSSYSWCSDSLLSPGTLSTLGQSAVI